MNTKKPVTTMTILGVSGSGKTCYLLGMYYKMAGGINGYTLHTDDDTDTKLQRRYEMLNDEIKGSVRFPKPTDMSERFIFDLQYAYNDILSFEWADYPGGFLKDKNDSNINEYISLKQSINNSSTLFICVDGSVIVGDDEEEKIDSVRDNCSNIINHFFSEYNKENDYLPPTAFIVTKFDEYMKNNDFDINIKEDKKEAEAELCEIIKEAFSGFFVKVKNKKNICAIIPVTLGNDISNNNYTGKLKPKNIQLPIFMGIWFALRKYVKNLYSKNGEIANQLEELNRNVNNSCFKNDIEKQRYLEEIASLRRSITTEESRLFGGKKNYILECRNKIATLNQKILTLENSNQTAQSNAISEKAIAFEERIKNMENVNEALNNSAKLLEKLDKSVPVIYINGEETTFKEIEEILDEEGE